MDAAGWDFAGAVGCVSVALFVLVVAAASVVDARERRIPNVLVGAAAALWVAARALLGAASGSVASAIAARMLPWGLTAFDGVTGALVLGGGALLAAAAFEALTGRSAMGGGDVKLLAVIGLFMGLGRGLVCLFVACVVAVAVSALRRIVGFSGDGTFPFAPALLAGVAVSAFL